MMPPVISRPGIYPGLPFDEYLRIPAVSQSRLKAMERSPLHYLHATMTEVEPTDSMRLGSLAHTLLLEPEAFSERFAVWPPEGTERKNDHFKGQDYKDFALIAAESGREIVKRRELNAALEMAIKVRRHKLAGPLLSRGQAEISMVWLDPPTGILCKGRIDFLCETFRPHTINAEVKTAADIAHGPFSQAFAKLGYDTQAGFYTMGWRALTGKELPSKCIAIESKEPHDVIVHDLEDVVETGREIARELLDKVAACQQSGKWPGQAEEAEVRLQLPRWRTGAYDDEAPFDFAELDKVAS